MMEETRLATIKAEAQQTVVMETWKEVKFMVGGSACNHNTVAINTSGAAVGARDAEVIRLQREHHEEWSILTENTLLIHVISGTNIRDESVLNCSPTVVDCS